MPTHNLLLGSKSETDPEFARYPTPHTQVSRGGQVSVKQLES